MWIDDQGAVHVADPASPHDLMTPDFAEALGTLVRAEPDEVAVLLTRLEQEFHDRSRPYRAAREAPFVDMVPPAVLLDGAPDRLIELQSDLQSVEDRWQLDAIRAVELVAAELEPSRPQMIVERLKQSLRRPHL